MLARILSSFGYEKRNLANPSPGLLAALGGTATNAGIAITSANALTSATTLAACRAIFESVAGLPFHLYRRGAEGSRERDSSHPAAQILSGDWCPWAGGAETKAALQLDALLHGTGYGLVVRAGQVPREIHRLDPRNVTRDFTGPEPLYRLRESGGRERVLDWRDVLTINTPGSTGSRVLCLVDLCREAIALDLLMAQHQSNLFANGARPSGALKTPKGLNLEILDRLRASFESAYRGGSNAGKTIILEDGLSFEALGLTSTDAQFLELRRLVIEEIARGFKVPATLIGDLERATWKNAEELMRQFILQCLMPWAEVWQGALERALLTPEERQTYFIEAVFDDLLRGDLPARFNAYRQACGGAWLTRNEIRAFDNKPPVAGGDELLLQAGQGDSAAASQQAGQST